MNTVEMSRDREALQALLRLLAPAQQEVRGLYGAPRREMAELLIRAEKPCPQELRKIEQGLLEALRKE